MFSLICFGCKPGSVTTPPPEQVPLMVDAWQQLPVTEKYTAMTFERLKAGDSKLQSEEGWRQFQRTTILPARKKDGLK